MRFLSYFLRKPFNHNPEDFKLRIVRSWFSDDYVEFEYSANGGRDWKKIYNSVKPFLGLLQYDYEWKPIRFRLDKGDFTYEREKFSSYQKILDFENKEKSEYEAGMSSVIKQRNDMESKKIEALKRANA